MSEELAKYLKNKKGLKRLFIKLKEKYISLGRYSGVIVLHNVTEEESIDIGNLLGYHIEAGSTIKTSYKELTKRFLETKYRDFSWEELLNCYFGESIIDKKQQKELNSMNEYMFFQNIFDSNKNRKYVDVLKKIIDEKKEICRLLKQKYNKNKDKLELDLNNILLLLDKIPKEPIPLAQYASITRNPHYLDLNTSESNLFFKILSYMKEEEYPIKIEDKIKLLSLINVYTDPISNYVITYKLIGNDILDVLSEKDEILNLNLLNITHFDKVDTKEKKVYIFENPSILNSLKDLHVPIIITSGIPNLSLYKLLEKLQDSGNMLYYNGDFDPEGLLIAEKLIQRYSNLKLFCYSKEDYMGSKSSNKISQSRLKKLSKVVYNDLQVIKRMLLNEKMSAYQEKNIERIRKYIIEDND